MSSRQSSQKKPAKRKTKESDDESDYIPEEKEAKSDKEEEEKIRVKLAKSGLNDDEDDPQEDENDEDEFSAKKKNKRLSTAQKSRSKSGTKKVKENDKKSTAKKEEEDLEVKLGFEDEKDDERSKMNPDEIELPWFVKKEHIRDKNELTPEDENYDPTTLYIPDSEYKKMPKTIKQYWEIKSENFDKIVAFKWWKFYYTWFEDAKVVHRITNYPLKATWGKYPGCFFHEYSLKNVAPLLVDQGYKLVVVEQMEACASSKDEVIKREVCQVISRGTYVDIPNESNYSSRYMLTLVEIKNSFGFAFIDATTNHFYIGEFEDDENKRMLRTLISRFKPVEVIHSHFISHETLALLRHSSGKPTFSKLKQDLEVLEDIFKKFDLYFTNENELIPLEGDQNEQFRDIIKTPGIFVEMKKAIMQYESEKPDGKQENSPFFMTSQAMNLCLTYLKQILLDRTVFLMGNFELYDIVCEKAFNLFMDSQALYNLELLECSYQSKVFKKYTLFDYMDKTKSPFGKRMLEKWIISPLKDIQSINERLDAIEDLNKIPDVTDYCQLELGKLPDIERKLYRVCNFAHEKKLNADYFEYDYVNNRLKEFVGLLSDLKKTDEIINIFADNIKNIKSLRLKQLLTFKVIKPETNSKKNKKAVEGLMPKMSEIIQDIEKMVIYIEGVPCPAPGLDQEYDALLLQIEEIKKELNLILEEEKKRFKNQKDVIFVNSKFRYEIEVPEALVEGNKRPEEYLLTSKRKGFLRFQTEEIRGLVWSLDSLQYQCKDRIVPFVIKFFHKFFQYNAYWQQMLSCLSELDCLCSLSRVSREMKTKCRPKFLKSTSEATFRLKGMTHPCIELTGVDFVSNDTIFENNVNLVLVTGPNMGGKSTLLRQNCIAIILAQMGSYVPAEEFILTPFDRIFTRIGAQDRILEGKSTFFVEMEETLSIVQEATENSFVIVDELGRGTSTYDGVSIAYAVLKFLVENSKCLSMFSTHFHLLIEDFKIYDNIKKFHMTFEEHRDKIKFLYKFREGYVPHSFGINVARLAGLPEEVIEIAHEKSKLMIKEKKSILNALTLNTIFNETLEITKLIEPLTEKKKVENRDELVKEIMTIIEEIQIKI